ncbi:chromate transporter [Heyndrickxia oleronia]|jgi:chromate transporter|uniref:chromate transporter n=1 Tax=Heyndrickxia oleronia TaxID=38875 RepID=UPI00217E5624|nr:chromate transporter [Heyndrickxia oleronia]MCI1589098.1 chromate transporter [Heyndrickxia oleronia]MCI1611810.1 chromate transporter [Heyndrickxia oleronia]MCI1743183.1 chromate transporter [Heyndrickxia oleronia]MCI1759678.1 chromate transporter [Heyndrickxia oleronia]
MLFSLFTLFLLIGAVSFGGGYAMIPVIGAEVTKKAWLTTTEYIDIVALAGMTPGSIASNSATAVGYKVAGIPGAIVSSIAITLPSIIFVLIIALFFYKINQNKLVQSAFYGLRPIVTSLIIYAAIHFAIENGVISLHVSWHMISLFLLFLASLVGLSYFKIHPTLVILFAGIIGVIIF